MNIELVSEESVQLDAIPFRTQLIGDQIIPLHTHTYYEFFYITSGSVKHYFNGQVQTLTTGDLYMIKPRDTHTFFPRESCHTHRDILISIPMWKSLCDYIHLDLSNTLLPSQQKISLSPLGVDSLENLLSCFQENCINNPNPCQNPFSYIIMVKLAENFLLLKEKNQASPPAWFLQLINYIGQPDFFTSGQKDIFKELHYSREYICRVFKMHLQETPTGYINHKRLDYAASLLCHTDKTVEEICFESGFNNLSYFNRIFKNRFKVTPPSKFRHSFFS